MSVELIQSRLDIPPEMDLLIVLGKNLGVDWTRERVQQTPGYLSIDSRINVLAAGELNRPGLTTLFSGGFTIGLGFPSQPGAAKAYLSNKYPHIPADKVLIDEAGFDTLASAESIAQMDLTKYSHVDLASIGRHALNSALIFKREGARVDSVIATESIIAERSKYHQAYIATRRELPRVKKEAQRERIRTVALYRTFARDLEN